MGGFQEGLTSKTPSVDSLVKCCRACLSLGWSMSGPKLQHLLGTSVFSLMLLPLVLSCDSNRTMREIAEDYESVISLLLQNFENNITESLKVSHKSCTGEMPECEKDNRSSQGQHTTHRHQRRKKKKPGGETEENRGTTGGGERLNSWKQQGRERKERSRSTEAMKSRRRQCGLKVFVDSLKECYMSLAERHGDLK
ncbi:uncharacterized protein LOC109898986 isoform X4 [Oncorhynchus kisutch]|uniref:uncharacterized protein LOC109898986 isoform X4 n=1 Tax=Oncorhynchus kisutch TaxID=8019 RepID=UPI00099FBFDF|nr:uncharacterized protein LOC109898986 isoform X4 [Oncorhynchus kisutch]